MFSGGAIGAAAQTCRGFLASIVIAAPTSDAFISSVDPSSDQVAFHRSLSDLFIWASVRFGTNLIASAPPLVLLGPGWTPPLVVTVMTRGVEPPPIP